MRKPRRATRTVTSAAILGLLAVLLAAPAAWAQKDGSPQTKDDPNGPDAVPARDLAAAPMPPPPAPVLVEDPLDRMRVRAGASAGFAMFIPGISYGPAFSGRAGVAFNRLLAAYLDFGFGAGFGANLNYGSGTGFSISVASYWRLSLVGELNLGPFFIALGPTLFDGQWMAVGEGVDSAGNAYQAAYVAGGSPVCPGVLGRIGFSFGRRNRFTLALEGQVIFGKMTSVSQNAGTGGVHQGVYIGADTVGFAPALMLGWDMK